MKIKKILAVALAIATLFSLCACQKRDENPMVNEEDLSLESARIIIQY